ncbi:MAG TPA: hypothetical protein VFC63_14135 [Blastocatellia bacterium]|nr:hypothetical protein [Blastocatellia bacterium]
MKLHKFVFICLLMLAAIGCLNAQSPSREKADHYKTAPVSTPESLRDNSSTVTIPSVTQASGVPIPIFPLIISYDYETKYFVQWIAGCPQYSMIIGTINAAKDGAPVVEISLIETATGKRVNYSNSEARVKAQTQVGLTAHFAKIDFQTGEDTEQRPAVAFGFADEHNVPIRWRFVVYGPSSDKGAGPRIQDLKNGLLVSYNDLGSTSASSSLVQIGDKSYEVEEWPEISKPPYFIGYRGTFSEGIALGTLLNGVENWRVESAPKELNQGAKWTLVNDKNVTRQLQITAKHGDELTISEIPNQSPWARSIELVVKSTPQDFALKSMTRRAGTDYVRVSFTPELNFSATSSATTEHTFQIDEHTHDKVLIGNVTLEAKNGRFTMKLHPKLDSLSRLSIVQKTYEMASNIAVEPNGYRIEVH